MINAAANSAISGAIANQSIDGVWIGVTAGSDGADHLPASV